jgi:hypothetical protein
MDISIYALEKIIAEHEENIANASKQLKDLEAGKIELSALKIASVENTLEHSQSELTRYKEIYDAIPEDEKEKFRQQHRIQEGLAKQSYYKLQKIRLKRNSNIKRNQLLESMLVIDELKHDIHFEDDQLIEVADVIIKYNIREVVELETLLIEIKEEFEKQKESISDDEDLKSFALLDAYIPIIILYFHVFIEDIKKSITLFNETQAQINEKEQKDTQNIQEKVFKGLPKYEDWWFEELFKNHQAYFALYKWKEGIENMCLSEHQKVIWYKIFNNWVAIKKILNNKEENGFEYTYLFDSLMSKYVELEEELEMQNLESMDKIILQMTQKQDLSKYKDKHSYSTTYLQYKKLKENN